jgi:hypothetical protein
VVVVPCKTLQPRRKLDFDKFDLRYLWHDLIVYKVYLHWVKADTVGVAGLEVEGN